MNTTPCATPVMGFAPNQSLVTMYLGKAGAMTKIRLPDAGGENNDLSRADVAHILASGGVTATRRRRGKRTFPIQLSEMTPDDAEALVSYYMGGRGLGPWRLINPNWRNALAFDASTMSVANGAPTVWNTNPSDGSSVGSLDVTDAPAILGSGVWKWTNAVNTHYLFEGTQAGGLLVPATGAAVPYLIDQPMTVSIYAKSLSGTPSVKLAALGCTATQWDGSSVAASAATPLNSSTWTRISAQIAVAAFPSTVLYVCLGVQCVSAGTPTILVSNAMSDIGVTGLRPWVTGVGIPNVSFSAPLTAAIGHVYWRRDHTLVLSEN